MSEYAVKRRLAAIMAADIVGYSRLMNADEVGTRARVNGRIGALIEPAISARGGRIVKTMGDGVLAEFASSVDALEAAVAIQKDAERANAEEDEQQPIHLRIGINLGDLIIEGDDIHGDGVNIAARLEAIAEPGGIVVSGMVAQTVQSKSGISLDDLGPQTLKNIREPVPAFRVRIDAPTAGPVRAAEDGLTLPDKPSVAVLPFDNMSGDPSQDFFAEGIADDIITELSRYDELFVISRHSAFAYRGRDIGVGEIARELGVKFVVEGSVRRAGNRVRVSAQLIDAPTGNHFWAERYDRDLDDIFAVQDEITAVIVNSLAGQITLQHHRRALAKNPEATDAYDHVLRAMMLIYKLTPEENQQARVEAQKAIDIDPAHARAHALLAWSHEIGAVVRWVDDPTASIERALNAAKRAVSLDEMDPWGHAALGHILLWGYKDHDRGISAFERAVSLNPNSAHFRSWYACGLCFAGNPEKALQEIELAMRLNPHAPPLYLNFLGRILFTAERYQEALPPLERLILAMPQNPSGHALAAASYAALGRSEDARAIVRQVVKTNPRFCVADVHLTAPYRHEAEMHRFQDLLRQAGLPEHAGDAVA